MADRQDTDEPDSGPSRATLGLRTSPSGEQVTRALRAIVDEVESRGPDGYWLSRSSVTVAKARIALQIAEFDKGHVDSQRREAALRDLVWRAEHVRDALATAGDGPERRELAALLDTSGARAALGLGGGAPEGEVANRHTRKRAKER